MSNFFSFCMDKDLNKLYFDWEIRKKILSGEIPEKIESAESHTSIANYYGYEGGKEDGLNFYEYNPLTKELVIDKQIFDDDNIARNWVKKLNFKKITPQLIIKPIINPFGIEPPTITREHIKLLKNWESVWESVWESAGASVWESVWESVRESVGASVGASVWASVWESVGASVEASMRASVWASMGAYIGSFFKLPRNNWKYTRKINTRYQYPFAPAAKLWECGLVPSFDLETWRLHGGKGAKILYEMEAQLYD